ncbi:MAG: hypothetical protein DELT_00030 [Desulfovibrio sp.]
MRLLLISLQGGVAAIFYSLVMGAFSSPIASGAGGNPLYLALEAVALAIQTIVIGAAFLPVIAGLLFFALLYAISLTCAVLCGYRILRWARWPGALCNLGMALFCFLFMTPGSSAGSEWVYFKFGVCVFFLLCAFLFVRVPKRPNIAHSRRMIAVAHPALPVLPAMLLLASVPPDLFVTLLAVMAVYAIPFIVNMRFTRSVTVPGPLKQILLPTIISLVFGGLSFLLFAPLAALLGISLFLFIGLLEMLLLYPTEPVTGKNWHYYTVALLGRQPEA